MNASIVIVDYGLGNLHSVLKAFQALGLVAQITSDPQLVTAASHIVLPGVGAFGDGMRGLDERGLSDALLESSGSGKWILGICLGMQLLLSESEEFGLHAGLDLIPGRVVALKSPAEVGVAGYKIPHVGWSRLLSRPGGQTWTNTVLQHTAEGSEFYFVHSFTAQPADPLHLLAMATYGGQEIGAVLQKDNVMGTQFHPEKSAQAGLSLIKSFCEL